jgi:hypothetical protein
MAPETRTGGNQAAVSLGPGSPGLVRSPVVTARADATRTRLERSLHRSGTSSDSDVSLARLTPTSCSLDWLQSASPVHDSRDSDRLESSCCLARAFISGTRPSPLDANQANGLGGRDAPAPHQLTRNTAFRVDADPADPLKARMLVFRPLDPTPDTTTARALRAAASPVPFSALCAASLCKRRGPAGRVSSPRRPGGIEPARSEGPVACGTRPCQTACQTARVRSSWP